MRRKTSPARTLLVTSILFMTGRSYPVLGQTLPELLDTDPEGHAEGAFALAAFKPPREKA